MSDEDSVPPGTGADQTSWWTRIRSAIERPIEILGALAMGAAFIYWGLWPMARHVWDFFANFWENVSRMAAGWSQGGVPLGAALGALLGAGLFGVLVGAVFLVVTGAPVLAFSRKGGLLLKIWMWTAVAVMVAGTLFAIEERFHYYGSLPFYIDPE